MAAVALNGASPLALGEGWTALTQPTPTTANASVSGGASSVSQVPTPGSPSVWQPRPLALPATDDQQQPWRPPAPVPTPAPRVVPTTIVIQPPAPTPPPVAIAEPPTPAEIRQEKLQQKRVDAKRYADDLAAFQPDRWLPPSDEINIGSRKSQLAAAVVGQLRIAHWAAQRGATESAKQAATQTLQTIAALRDTQIGDNAYTLELGVALNAIRESADFSGRYGPVDPAAIGRLIDVHQTPVLKGVVTTHLTSARAVEAYLQFAQDRLVTATSGGPLAAEAMMILADLESLTASTNRSIDSPPEHSPLHAAELALMYRRAAVAIAPENADAAAELGRTLLKRSLPLAAKDWLLQSVRVQPTRQRMESLLEAAAKTGDFVLVDQCEKQLAMQQLPSELPVQMMSPQEFARTGQTIPPPAFAASVASQRHSQVAPFSPQAAPFSPQAVPGTPSNPAYRVSSRPITGNQLDHRLVPSSAASSAPESQIVDPSLPQQWQSGPGTASTPQLVPAPTQSQRRLFW